MRKSYPRKGAGMTDRELLQDALDALQGNWRTNESDKAIEALRARLAQPEPAECDGGQCGIGGYCKQCPKTQHEPEPVAWGVPNTRPTEKAQFMMLLHSPDGCQYPEQLVPLYTSPPQQPEQEPVGINKVIIDSIRDSSEIVAPPQREWVGLTDDEIEEGLKQSWVTEQAWQSAVWWAEAKLKEKNT